MNSIKQWWIEGRVYSWSRTVVRWHPLSSSISELTGLLTGFKYEDDYIRIDARGGEAGDINITLKLDGNLPVVYSTTKFLHRDTQIFRPGCWVEHLKSLVAAAKTNCKRISNKRDREINAGFEPVDDCHLFEKENS
jgi:hypothetical protein